MINSRIAKLLTKVLLLEAMVVLPNVVDSKNEHHRHHHSLKTWHNLETFEGDIVPEYNQILKCYGANTTAELVAQGILTAAKDSRTTHYTMRPAAALGRDYYRL